MEKVHFSELHIPSRETHIPSRETHIRPLLARLETDDDRIAVRRDGLGLDPEAVDWALRGLEIVAVNKPVAFTKAAELGQREIGVAGGKAGPGRGHKTSSNTPRLTTGSKAHIEARLRRDGFDELANAVAAKTLSARAAAREAGIIIPPTPLTIIRRAWKRMSPADDWFDALSRGCYLAAFRLFRSGQARLCRAADLT